MQETTATAHGRADASVSCGNRDGGKGRRLTLAEPVCTVLIVEIDCLAPEGGGQTGAAPADRVAPQDRFYYFLLHERPRRAAAGQRCVGIPLRAEIPRGARDVPLDQQHLLLAYRDAAISRSASRRCCLGHNFDVVDVPDYSQHGVFIRAALAAEGLSCGIVALALHGYAIVGLGGRLAEPRSAATMLQEMRLREACSFAPRMRATRSDRLCT